jgi:hypothetical protein
VFVVPSTTMRAVSLAGLVGLLVVLATWLLGPSVFAGADEPERVVTAKVTAPAQCDAANAVERVSFADGAQQRTADLPACGHDRGEELKVAVNQDGSSVHLAETSAGYSNARQSTGLLLIALSCAGGGGYVYLLARSRYRTKAASAA